MKLYILSWNSCDGVNFGVIPLVFTETQKKLCSPQFSKTMDGDNKIEWIEVCDNGVFTDEFISIICPWEERNNHVS